MKCPACGTLNDADAVYCKRCGSKLGVGKCSKCSAVADPDAIFCSSCGAKLSSDDSHNGKVCQSCGFVNKAGTNYCKRCNQKII